MNLRLRSNKYHAKKTIIDGESFPSKLEADTYCLLKSLQSQNIITNLKRHGSIRLTKANISYKPDFTATLVSTGKPITIEAKGMETDRWKLIKKLWTAYGPNDLHIYKTGYKEPKLVEIIKGPEVHD